MQIDSNFMFPVYMIKALKLMGIEGLGPRHITVITLISQGYITSRQLLLATNELTTAPRNYDDLNQCLHFLRDNGFVHIDDHVMPNFHGRTHAICSLTLDGYSFMHKLNRKVLCTAKKKHAAKIKPFSKRGIS